MGAGEGEGPFIREVSVASPLLRQVLVGGGEGVWSLAELEEGTEDRGFPFGVGVATEQEGLFSLE